MKKISLFEELKKSDDKYRTFYDVLANNTYIDKKPLSILLELTPLCNFNCKVCYIRMSEDEVKLSGNHVKCFEEWKYYIDGFCDMGVLSFTLSGGECTLHPDFKKIYKYIYSKGCEIILLTNGSNITDSILDLLTSHPPKKIYITLYGSSSDTYEVFCSNRAGYEKVINNIDLLLERRLPLLFSYTVGKDNFNDLESANKYAHSKHVPLVSVDMLINYNKADGERVRENQVDYEKYQQVKNEIYMKQTGMKKTDFEQKTNYLFSEVEIPIRTKGLTCGGGSNNGVISWDGKMKPCVTFDVFAVDPHDVGGIAECWKQMVKWAENVPLIIECQQCIFQNYCTTCIANHYCDTKQFGVPSPRICFKKRNPELAAKMQAEYDRRQALKKTEETEE